MKRLTKLEQAIYGIESATRLLKITGASKYKRSGAYKLNNSLFTILKYVMIPRDLESPIHHEFIVENRLLHKMDKSSYKFIKCRSIDDVLDCLTMLSKYIGDKIK